MQHTLLQGSIIYNILHVALLFYIVIPTGCDGCKRNVSKETNIVIGTTNPTEIPKEKASTNPKETANQDLSKDFLDTPGKERDKAAAVDDYNDNDAIQKEIQEAVLAEQPNIEEKLIEEQKKIEATFDHSYQPKPSAPDLALSSPSTALDAPPPYDSHDWGGDVASPFPYPYPTPTAPNAYTDADQVSGYTFDNDDVKDLFNHPSFKRKCMETSFAIYNTCQAKLTRWLAKKPLYSMKQKLEKAKKKQETIRQSINEIASNTTLSSSDKARKIQDIYIGIARYAYKIGYLEKVIEYRQKKDRSAKSSDQCINPYGSGLKNSDNKNNH